MLSKGFWVFARGRCFMVRNRRFGTTCLFHFQAFEVIQNNLVLPRDPEGGADK
jgi:hypothetical protein